MKKFITTAFAIALSFGSFAQQQQNDTMFIHTNNPQFIHEFATHEVDSIVFVRTQPRMIPPACLDTVTFFDTITHEVTIFDTITHEVTVFDTITHEVTIFDTITHEVTIFDTITHEITVFDTITHEVTIFDTIIHEITIFDTIGVFDTVWRIDTIFYCPEPIAVTGVTLNPDSVLLGVGDTFLLSAIVQPDDATNQNVIWSSNNPGVATIDSNGVVIAVSSGIATISVTTQEGNFTAFGTISVIVMTGCNRNPPGWGETLGVVSFYTDNEWLIEGNGIIQIWSDAVTATACQKETFDGGIAWGDPDFNADCRSNPDFPGDFFSWCAVMRFAETLCPYPWRVPTIQDFIDLDIAMGGTGIFRRDLDFVNTNYITRWGGRFGGNSRMGALLNQGNHGFYWSQTEYNARQARGLQFSRALGDIHPQRNYIDKDIGYTLRCIRNN